MRRLLATTTALALMAAPALADHGIVTAVGSGTHCYHFNLHSFVTDTDVEYGVDYNLVASNGLDGLVAATGWMATINQAFAKGATLSLNPMTVIPLCGAGGVVRAFNINSPSVE
jgi:hypothetical protein